MDLSVKIEPIELSELDCESVFQTSFWAEAKKGDWMAKGFKYVIGERRGSVLILFRSLFSFFRIAYAPFGLYPEISGEEYAAFAKEVKKFLPPGCFILRFDFPWNSESIKARRVRSCKESIQPEGTVRLNLSENIELKSRAKRNLKKEERIIVTLWDGSDEEFDEWFNTYRMTGMRDNFTTRPKDYVKKMLLLEDSSVRPLLYLAKLDDEIIGGILNLRGQHEEVYLYGSSVKHTDNISCGYSLQYHAIKQAKEAGVLYYDLFGIPSRNGGAHLQSLEVFKTSFGGEKTYRAPTTDYIYNHLIYSLYRTAENIRFYLHRSKV